MRNDLVVILFIVASMGNAQILNPVVFGAPLGPNGFSLFKTVTFDHTKDGAADTTNFPALISGTYSYLAAVGSGGNVVNTTTQTGGGASITVPADVWFTSDAGCTSKLAGWEYETYDSTSGAVNIWVNVGTLTHSSNLLIYMCIGKASLTTWQGNVNGTWVNYVAVYHFPDGSSLSAADSTSNAYNGTITSTTATAGVIDGGASYGGSSKIVSGSTTQDLSTTKDYSIIAWIKPALASGSLAGAAILSFDNGIGTVRDYMRWEPTLGWYFDIVGAGGSINWLTGVGVPSFTANSTHQVGFSHSGDPGNGGIGQFWWDGNTQGTTLVGSTSTVTVQNFPISVGFGSINSYHFNGVLDEVKLAAFAYSASQTLAEYNNQLNPSSFYTVTP